MMVAPLSSDQVKLILKMYGEDTPLASIREATGVSNPTIYKYAREAGISRKLNIKSNKYHVNHEAFDELSPECAYWLGFLAGDGHFRKGKGKPIIQCELGGKDTMHLERLRVFLDADHPIRRTKNTLKPDEPKAILVVRSEQIFDAIQKYGLARLSPERDPSPLLRKNRNFWRGMIDSDGYVAQRAPSRKTACWQITFYGHFPLIGYFMEYCSSLGVLGQAQSRSYPGVHRVTLYGKRARALMAELYRPGDMALPRKAEIALQAADFKMQGSRRPK